MKRQKHYDTAQSIEAEIDKLNESKRNNLVEWNEANRKIEMLLIKLTNPSGKTVQIKQQIDFQRIAMEALDKRRPLIEQKLTRLKKTHAAFHTVDMFGVQETVLQK